LYFLPGSSVTSSIEHMLQICGAMYIYILGRFAAAQSLITCDVVQANLAEEEERSRLQQVDSADDILNALLHNADSETLSAFPSSTSVVASAPDAASSSAAVGVAPDASSAAGEAFHFFFSCSEIYQNLVQWFPSTSNLFFEGVTAFVFQGIIQVYDQVLVDGIYQDR